MSAAIAEEENEGGQDGASRRPASLQVLFGRAHVNAQQLVVVARAGARPEQLPLAAGRRLDGPHALHDHPCAARRLRVVDRRVLDAGEVVHHRHPEYRKQGRLSYRAAGRGVRPCSRAELRPEVRIRPNEPQDHASCEKAGRHLLISLRPP